MSLNGKPRVRRAALVGSSILLLGSLLLLSGCGGVTSSRSGMLYGKVYETQTGSLASGQVVIKIAGSSTYASNGTYQSGKLPFGQYLATVEGEGYGTKNVTVSIQKIAQTQDIFLDLLPDSVAPSVESVAPEDGSAGADPGSPVRITFSEPMNQASVQGAFTISPPVSGTFSWANHQVSFVPQQGLAARTHYTVTLKATAADRVGNALAGGALSWSFTTGDAGGLGSFGRITFASHRDGVLSGIYAMDETGANLTKTYYSGSEDEGPAWSPDGTRLAYSSRQGATNPDIWIMNADRTQRRITNSPGIDTAPSWSPDGATIVFQSNWDYRLSRADSIFRLYKVSAAGGVPEPLTDANSWAEAPSWSPDGAKIAFASSRSGQMHIYVVDAAGEGAGFTPTGPLGEDPSDAADTGPVWSPDGAKIAFTSDRTGVWQIYVMDADGANVERVTNSLGPDQDPSWSPDGRSLAFVSERDGNREIYKIGIDGTGETRLTNNSGMDYNPAWYR